MNAVYTYILLFFFGSLWGSFFYTLSRRYRNKKYLTNFLKMFYEPSHCPNCNERINPIFLTPIFGYLFTLGKCRKCKTKISLSYLLNEIIFGLLPISLYLKFGISIYSFIIFLILCIAITISIIDFRTMTIPDSLLISFFLLSLYPVIYHSAYQENLYGFLLMTLVFLSVMLVFPGGFGGGDLKYASCIGFFLGFLQSVIVLETALITGSIIGIMYGILSKKGLRASMPFAPFLTLGLLIALFFGKDIILIYHRLMY